MANLALILLFLYVFQRLVEGHRDGHWYALLLAGAGLFAVVAHGYVTPAGRPEFLLPVSLGLLGTTAIVSVGQTALAPGALRVPTSERRRQTEEGRQ